MKGKPIKGIPVVGYVVGYVREGGRVFIPDGVLEAIDAEVEREKGKRIYPNCSVCGEMVIAREKVWDGICPKCKGEKEKDPFDNIPVMDNVDEQILDKIREKCLEHERGNRFIEQEADGDVLNASIILEAQEGNRTAWCYLYRSKQNRVFIMVDESYKVKGCMCKY